MYFANMFCYGRDTTTIGVTGILGCLGIIYVGAGAMYATHIVCGSERDDADGRETFTSWIKRQEQRAGKGHLFLFTNARNRPQAAEEARELKKALNGPATTVYQIMKNLEPKVGTSDQASVVTLLDRGHSNINNPSGCNIFYKKNEDIVWVDGGSAESGQYKARPSFCGAKIPSDVTFGWRTVGAGNCEVTTI